MRAQLSTILILSLLAAFPSLFGQQKIRQLTLDEAIAISKAQSPDALNAKQTFRTSYWEYRSYLASNMPALTLTGTTPNINQSIMSQQVNGEQSYSSYKYISAQANLALAQKIGITGGTVSINSYLSGVYNVDKPNPTPYVSYPVTIELNQPIFTYNSYRWDLNLLQAQVEKKIALINQSNYDTLYHIAKGRFQLGKIAENDLLQLELSFLKAQAQVENANLALDNAQFLFKSYLRLQDSTHILLLPPDHIDFFRIDPNKAVELAVQNSSSTLECDRRLLEAASAVHFARMDGRFDANIHALIGLQQQAGTIPDVYSNPADQRQISLGLTIPIVDWGVAHGKIMMAQSQQQIVKTSVEQEIIDFQRNVYLKIIQFNMQQNQLMIAAKSDTVARKSYEVTKGRYLIGKINSILDLNNAQIETDNSEKNYYSALQTYWRSYYEIRKMTLFDFAQKKALQFELKDIK